jgi:hypothetical protein
LKPEYGFGSEIGFFGVMLEGGEAEFEFEVYGVLGRGFPFEAGDIS